MNTAKAFTLFYVRLIACFSCALLGCAAPADPSGDTEDDTGDTEDDTGGATDDLTDPCAGGGAPSLTIGHGAGAYMQLADGAQLELEHGPQGGVHTVIALHATDVDASVQLEGQLEGFLNGQKLARATPYLNMLCNVDEGGLQVWNLFLIWDADPVDLHMQSVLIEAEFEDNDGVKVTASKEAILYDPLLE